MLLLLRVHAVRHGRLLNHMGSGALHGAHVTLTLALTLTLTLALHGSGRSGFAVSAGR